MHAPRQLPPDPHGAAEPSGSLVPSVAERAVWEAFYRDHKDEVFRVVRAIVGDEEQAADAVDEAFYRAFVRWERISTDPDQRRHWVTRTALNYVKRSWQRVGSRETHVQPLRAYEPTGQTETEQLIRKLLQQLPPRQREVIGLRYLADLDPKEVAQVLGISPNTVAVHEHRGMKILRIALEDGGEAQ